MDKKIISVFVLVVSVAGFIVSVNNTEATTSFKCNEPSTGPATTAGQRCGVRGDDFKVINCGADFVCTSNEFNSCPTRVCLKGVGGDCTDNTDCEGGSFCELVSTASTGKCAITSQTEQATSADLRDTIRRAINIILGFLGILTVILVLYGGFVWLTAAGSEDNVKKGRDILIWAAIGAIVISIAWTISSYILNVASKVG